MIKVPHSPESLSKVFISYTQESHAHSERVLNLSNSLRSAGFNCDIDQYHVNERWPTWMERRIDWADFVLVVCTATYLRRWKGEEPTGVGLGAQWESLLTRQRLYESPERNDKFVPVIFDRTDIVHIPPPLRDVSRIWVGDGIESLTRRLLGLAPAEMPPIRTSLAPIALAPGFFCRDPIKTTATATATGHAGLSDSEEMLISNLLPVLTPAQINTAKIVRKKKRPRKFETLMREAWATVGGVGPTPVGFWYEDGVVYTFEDLNEPVWKELFARNTLAPNPPKATAEWAESESMADKNRFIKLLKRAFQQMCQRNGSQHRLAYSKAMNCYLFQVTPGSREGSIKTLAVKTDADHTVYKAIRDTRSEKPDAIQHWKHEAFRFRFERLGDTWYLVLTPFWAFTADGVESPSPWQRTSSANMRKPEKNRAVLGHVMFWASVLCREEDLLPQPPGIRILRPVVLMGTPSISDREWINVTKDAERAELESDLMLELV